MVTLFIHHIYQIIAIPNSDEKCIYDKAINLIFIKQRTVKKLSEVNFSLYKGANARRPKITGKLNISVKFVSTFYLTFTSGNSLQKCLLLSRKKSKIYVFTNFLRYTSPNFIINYRFFSKLSHFVRGQGRLCC